jgi:hypothetical protein
LWIISVLLFMSLLAAGCEFKMGDGSPAPVPSQLISSPFTPDPKGPSPLVIPYDTDQLIIQSDCIILGQVSEVLPTQQEAQKEGGSIRYNVYTDIVVRSERCFLGGPAESLTIRIQGGKIGSLVMWAGDVPLFAKGERALLFLHRSPDSSSNYVITGVMQGKYEIRDGSFVNLSGKTITASELEKKIARIQAK